MTHNLKKNSEKKKESDILTCQARPTQSFSVHYYSKQKLHFQFPEFQRSLSFIYKSPLQSSPLFFISFQFPFFPNSHANSISTRVSILHRLFSLSLPFPRNPNSRTSSHRTPPILSQMDPIDESSSERR